jgi:hypothetical protein
MLLPIDKLHVKFFERLLLRLYWLTCPQRRHTILAKTVDKILYHSMLYEYIWIDEVPDWQLYQQSD